MNRTKKQIAPTVPLLQFSVKGMDAKRRDCIMVVSGRNEDEFAAMMQAAQPIIDSLTDFPRKPSPPPTDNPAPAQNTQAEKCPRCGSEVIDKRFDSSRLPRQPLVACTKCAFRLWQAPRRAHQIEIDDMNLWLEKHPDDKKLVTPREN